MTRKRAGFACTECGARHAFGAYVMAHWDLPLRHTCTACGAVHEVMSGAVELITRGDGRATTTRRRRTTRQAGRARAP